MLYKYKFRYKLDFLIVESPEKIFGFAASVSESGDFFPASS